MNRVRKTVLPLLAAVIWGVAFVAQRVGAGLLPPLTFNALRSALAAAGLGLAVLILSRVKKEPFLPAAPAERKALLLGGLCCGAALTVATYLQQAGLAYTTPGKAGFITALYIVLVPVFGLVIKKRAGFTVWIAVAIAAVGLYFLCIKDSFALETGDTLIILCAAVFAVQILCVDHFSARAEGLRLSFMMFAVMTVLSALGALLFERADPALITQCWIPLVYTGIFSGGVGYTLQIFSQKDANPTVVSLLMSMESVFSVLASALLLKERLSGREFLGCALMLAAVILTQLPIDKIRKKV